MSSLLELSESKEAQMKWDWEGMKATTSRGKWWSRFWVWEVSSWRNGFEHVKEAVKLWKIIKLKGKWRKIFFIYSLKHIFWLILGTQKFNFGCMMYHYSLVEGHSITEVVVDPNEVWLWSWDRAGQPNKLQRICREGGASFFRWS